MKTLKHRPPSKNKRPQWYTRRSAKKDFESALRAYAVEDKVVARGWDDPAKSLSGLASLAAQATDRLREEARALPEGCRPWIWTVYEEDQNLIERLQQKMPADAKTVQAMSALLEELLQDATADEVVMGTSKALKTIESRARWRMRLP